MAAIALENLTKRFGRVVAVNNLTLEVRAGELLAILGPSGCGKTTLLRLIAGLERATSGTIRIGGRVVNELAPKDRGAALVFQDAAVYPHLTVRANLEFPLRAQRAPRLEVIERANETARLLGIDALLDRKPGELSGGERQRVAMGRALIRRPSCLLLDEPLSQLDGPLRRRLRAEIRSLQRRLGVTTLYVTHDLEDALALADRLAVMRAGRIEQLGEPSEVKENPASAFVAEFVE